MIKYTDEQPDEKIQRLRFGRVLRIETHRIGLHDNHPHYVYVFIFLEALRTLFLGDFMEASSLRHD